MPDGCPPNDDRYSAGLARMRELGGAETTDAFLESVAETAPDLGRYVAEFVYGDLSRREGLGLHTRQMATLATLVALGGCERQLSMHIGAALDVGVPQQAVVELFIHQSAYAGFPVPSTPWRWRVRCLRREVFCRDHARRRLARTASWSSPEEASGEPLHGPVGPAGMFLTSAQVRLIRRSVTCQAWCQTVRQGL